MNKQSRTNEGAWNHRAYEYWRKYNGSPKDYALGSNGRKAIPLSLLGADVTIIDISEENRRYALELAQAAGVSLRYEIGDFITYRDEELLESFDIVFCEGGILHYFSDLMPFLSAINGYLKIGGTLVLNDFHPFRKALSPENGTDGDYFEAVLHEGRVAYEDRFSNSRLRRKTAKPDTIQGSDIKILWMSI